LYYRVKLVEDFNNGTQYALKITEWKKDQDKSQIFEMLKNEIKVLQKCHHPNILKMHDYKIRDVAINKDFTSTNVSFIVLELLENGDLLSYLSAGGRFSEPIARFYFKQLITALEHLAVKGYSHRDVKPHNCLLDENYNLKLADFGFASKVQSSSTLKGTLNYIAPEVLRQDNYHTIPVDIFAAGVTLFVVATGFMPFWQASKKDYYYNRIASGKWDDLWAIYENECGVQLDLSESFKNLIELLLSPVAMNRPNFKQIIEHSWFTGESATPEEIYLEMSNRRLLPSYKPSEEDVSMEEITSAESPDIMKQKTVDCKPLPEAPNSKTKIKYSEFYISTDGEYLVNHIEKFSDENKLICEKCPDYFRATIKHTEDLIVTEVFCNILKEPKKDFRCIEFKLKQGSYRVFNDIINSMQQYMRGQLKAV